MLKSLKAMKDTGFELALQRVDLRDAAAVWMRHAEIYLRLWKTELLSLIHI